MKKNHQNLRFIVVFAAFFCAIILLRLFPLQAKNEDVNTNYFVRILIVLAICLLLAIWYVVPVFKKSLRQIPFLKASTVAFVWSLILIAIPTLLFHPILPINEITLYFIFFYALTIPFNIRDQQEDKKEAKTLVHLIGERNAVIAGVTLMICFHTGLFTIYPILLTSGAYLAFAFCSIVLLALAKSDRPLSYYALIDGLMLFLGAVLLNEQ
ncbi:MAG: hypothetical protein V4638_00300 [Bacteroidota bacterium]